jgi:hypothetical protein
MSGPHRGLTKKRRMTIEVEERERGIMNKNKVLTEISP